MFSLFDSTLNWYFHGCLFLFHFRLCGGALTNSSEEWNHGRLGREGFEVARRTRPTGRELDVARIEEKLGWLREYREPLRRWAAAMAVIATAATLVRRAGYHAASAAQFPERLPQLEAGSLADRLRGKLLEFIKEQALHATAGERLPGSSEVLESIIGKYKTLQGERGQFGVTGMLLAIGAFVGRVTVASIATALKTINAAALKKWENSNLGSTIQSQRKQAFPSPKRGTKTGSPQWALTCTN